jgi:hypothetical protein
MQHDGNLVHYEPNNVATWSLPWYIAGSRAVMQHDGNFVVYGPQDQVVFHTHTWGQPGLHLELRGRGDFVLRNGNYIAYDNGMDSGVEGTGRDFRYGNNSASRFRWYHNGHEGGPGGYEWLEVRATELGNVLPFYYCTDSVFDWLVQQPFGWHRHYDSRVVRRCADGSASAGSFEWEQHHDWIIGPRLEVVCRFAPQLNARGHCSSSPGGVDTYPTSTTDFWYTDL